MMKSKNNATKPENHPQTNQPAPVVKPDIRERLARLTQRGLQSDNPEPKRAILGTAPQPDTPGNVPVPTHQKDCSNPQLADNQVCVSDLEEHEYAKKFPMLHGDEMAALTENIKTHGLLEPVVRYQGKVLDGRQRLAACKFIGVKPTFVEFVGDDAAAFQFVLAKNIHRRNLTKSQRAAIAAELLVLYEEQAAERKRLLAGTRRNPDGTKPTAQITEKIPEPAGEARKQAAQVMDVNDRYVSDAKAIKDVDAGLHEQMKSGKITMGAAKKRLAEKSATPVESFPENATDAPAEEEQSKTEVSDAFSEAVLKAKTWLCRKSSTLTLGERADFWDQIYCLADGMAKEAREQLEETN